MFINQAQEQVFPVLTIVKVVNRLKIFNIDLSDRFLQAVPAGVCPFEEFKISKVYDGENDVEVKKSDYSSLFKLSKNGTFELLKFD
jgi:hypothetical protein